MQERLFLLRQHVRGTCSICYANSARPIDRGKKTSHGTNMLLLLRGKLKGQRDASWSERYIETINCHDEVRYTRGSMFDDMLKKFLSGYM